MKTEEIKDLFVQFENIVCEYKDVECWSARELQKLLGYAKWEKFLNVIAKAEEACKNAGEDIENHFPHVGKMVSIGSSAERTIAIIRSKCDKALFHIDTKMSPLARM